MASVNKVMMIGKLTRDPEIKYTQAGLAIATLGMALNRVWFDKNTHEKREEVTFVDVSVFGKTAEAAGQYLAKGREVYIEGYLKLDQWDDKQTGQKRSKLKVVCERMQFIGNKPQAQQGGEQQQRPVSNTKPQQRPVSNAKPQQTKPAPPADDLEDFSGGADEPPF